ncbi:MAG: SMC-Scp complex subunit ScpB [Nanoarchaeota archaeon]|nr:SMC-Scp complex subunit ScpB [Nanoarchaeota archaeon]
MIHDGSKVAELEALLFYHGDPISHEDIAKFLDISKKEVRPLLLEYQNILSSREEGGLELLLSDFEVQLVTSPKHGDLFRKLQEEELKEELTPAALQALSVVAYLGPLTRPEIDYIRGVNSSFTLRGLILRGLVNRVTGGKRGAFQYSASFEFLKHMGIGSAEGLPEYAKYKSVLERLREQSQIISND